MIRRIPFTGALNFRDIGGYPARDGGRTRWGAVYRSDSLSFLTAGDLPAFDALGIKAVYDLRRSGEIAAHPGPREHVHLELASRDPLADGQAASLVTRRDGERWLLVLDDYQLTSGYRGVAHSSGVVTLFVRAGMGRSAAEGLLGAPRWVLAQALGELDDTYGGIAGYLLGPGQMRPAALAALRTALLSGDPQAPDGVGAQTGGTP